ncbi:hypothetical protein KFE25_005096 [Diacronema lutheri]|uniref:Cytosine-specific methyltransferase n=1 Tax=Diacronema lutheri TaxID=2081491 RepID=A0A8J5X7P2_DIALT|nr:hypothetical protein KFE25_005096 [Diacronema lutheri]
MADRPEKRARTFLDGCAVGALVCEARDVQAVRTAVDAAGWRKGAGCIVDVANDGGARDGADAAAPAARTRASRKAVHVSPQGAAALDQGAGAVVPDAIADLLRTGRATWASGLRQRARAHERRTPAPRGAWFTFAELFAGIGGFRCGLEPLGGQCVFASEVDPVARRVYEANFGDVPAGDITGVEAEDVGAHDVLTAGFPCQPFSRCGAQPGLVDRRGQLFYEIVRVARRWRPKAIMLENVENVAETNGGADLAEILGALEQAGYVVSTRVLDSADLLPQRRKRLYFVALRADLLAASRAFAWPRLVRAAPAGSGGCTLVRSVLQPSGEVDASYTLPPSLWAAICARERTADALARRLVRLDGVTGTLMSSYRRSPQIYSRFVNLGTEARAASGPAQGASVAGRGGGCDGGACDGSDGDVGAVRRGEAPPPPPRFFTERECCRLQGFDDSFVIGDFGQAHRFYHCIGNAVCPPVVREVGKAVLCALLAEPSDAALLLARGSVGRVGEGLPYPLTWTRRT